jgi:membrane protein YdbS with pleckstrin-like domain
MIRPQPRGREGTSDQPYSALNLRLVFALFGLVAAVVAGIWFWRSRLPVWTVLVTVVIAVSAITDLVVVILRRRARHRADPSHHSIFQ